MKQFQNYSEKQLKEQKKRLRELMSYLNVNQTGFAKLIHTSTGTVSTALNKIAPFTAHFLTLLTAININQAWLLEGEGNKIGNKPILDESVITNREVFTPKMSDETKLKYQKALTGVQQDIKGQVDESPVRLMKDLVRLQKEYNEAREHYLYLDLKLKEVKAKLHDFIYPDLTETT